MSLCLLSKFNIGIKMNGRKFEHPTRMREYTDIVYGGIGADGTGLTEIVDKYKPGKSPYNIYWGEIHGHTELSDGVGTPDEYLTAARDVAKLDFCAITDHDHGGVGSPELWGDKWELTQEKIAQYHKEGEFVTLLAYERDSYPWYSNLCIYYRGGQGDMIRGEVDGEITREELRELLKRDDVIAIPHHTADIMQGVNFDAVDADLMTPLMEVYSKWGTSEYFGNPHPVHTSARGGFWLDALERGAKMGCVAGSDIHSPYPGIEHDCRDSGNYYMGNLIYKEPGIVAVLAKELTREAVFDALKDRRCYASAGTKVDIDFRINGAEMGSELAAQEGEDRWIYFNVDSEKKLERVDLVKNGKVYMQDNIAGRMSGSKLIVNDLEKQRDTDYYYLRVTHTDGTQAWTSPIWLSS
jgi:hypothetical protein